MASLVGTLAALSTAASHAAGVVAARSRAATPQAPPARKGTATRKSAPSRPATAPRRATRKPAPRKTAPRPVMKPAADIPDRVPTALTHGCLTPAGVGHLAAQLGLNETQLARVLADGGVMVGEGVACVPYAAVTAGDQDAASALFLRARDAGDRAAISILRRAEGRVSLTASDCACADTERRELHLPAQDPRGLPSDLLSGLPEPVQWQLSVLVPQMLGATEPEPSMSDAESGAGPEVDESATGLHSAVPPLGAEEAAPVGPRQLRVVLEQIGRAHV